MIAQRVSRYEFIINYWLLIENITACNYTPDFLNPECGILPYGCHQKCGAWPYQGVGKCSTSSRCECKKGWTGPEAEWIVEGEHVQALYCDKECGSPTDPCVKF
jgi:hypothetical protein